MKTICFVATKGGTGKTSLAFAVGIEASKHGSVYFVDMDPQRSLTQLCERRGKDFFGENPALLSGVSSLSSALATLKRTEFERDFVIVDTPGSMMKIIADAIEASDCIVLPVQPSPLDILAQEDAAQLVVEAGKQGVAIFVMNRVDPASKAKDLEARIRPIFPNPPVRVNQRAVYAKSLISGKSAVEVDEKAASEIGVLWAAMTKILGEGENHGNEDDIAGRRAEKLGA